MTFALWHGGINYAQGTILDSLEEFPSKVAAGRALLDRAERGHRIPQAFHYVDRPVEHALTPNADEGASMDLYDSDPREGGELVRRLTLGPRGGVKEERA